MKTVYNNMFEKTVSSPRLYQGLVILRTPVVARGLHNCETAGEVLLGRSRSQHVLRHVLMIGIRFRGRSYYTCCREPQTHCSVTCCQLPGFCMRVLKVFIDSHRHSKPCSFRMEGLCREEDSVHLNLATSEDEDLDPDLSNPSYEDPYPE